jgi:hypothetical protein
MTADDDWNSEARKKAVSTDWVLGCVFFLEMGHL